MSEHLDEAVNSIPPHASWHGVFRCQRREKSWRKSRISCIFHATISELARRAWVLTDEEQMTPDARHRVENKHNDRVVTICRRMCEKRNKTGQNHMHIRQNDLILSAVDRRPQMPSSWKRHGSGTENLRAARLMRIWKDHGNRR